jgi:uncharacterized Zn-binding protein involved in type VI secretion
MPKNVGRIGDLVGAGALIGPLAPNVLINGQPIALVGTPVSSHGTGVHAAAVMTGASTVLVNGIPVVGTGDVATCGDVLIATSNVFVG